MKIFELTNFTSFFTTSLLNWYDLHGRKNLPWQNQDPYAVWLSEIMLQQTQVKTVIAYYHAFIARFPTIDSLAQANEDEVLHYWSGLGYYSRARNLHKTARILAADYAGQLPNTHAELLALPGIGDSTAAAILAQAYHQPVAIFDANVKRVLCRFHGIEQDITRASTLNLLKNYADQYVSQERPAGYTQAIMDLGALVCRPKNPQCALCPLAEQCTAKASGLASSLPLKPAKKKLPEVHKQFVIFMNKQDEILLEKRDYAAVWQGLWSLPELDLTEDAADMARQFAFTPISSQKLNSIKHVFSHYVLYIHPICIKVDAPLAVQEENLIWYSPVKHKLGLPKPVSVLVKHALQTLL